MARAARILTIDDDPHALNTLVSFLTSRGYEALPAQSLVEGLKLVALAAPDVVLLDTTMPDIDEVAALGAIRAGDPDVPVIMLSDNVTLQRVRNTMSHGAFEYLVKPFECEDVSHAIEAAIARRG